VNWSEVWQRALERQAEDDRAWAEVDGGVEVRLIRDD